MDVQPYYDPETGNTTYVYPDGTNIVYNEDGEIIGGSYPGATPVAELPPVMSDGQSVVYAPGQNAPLMDSEGNYLLAPAPEDAESFHYETAGHPAYDAGMYPAFEAGSLPAASSPNPFDPSGYTQSASSYGYSRNSYSGGGGYSSGGGGGGYGSSPSYPTYADGSLHPAWGGSPRVPGGIWNDGIPSERQQVYVPGGAAAGPYSTRGANPTSASYGGRGSSSSGGGGGGSALYQAWRDKLTAKLFPGSGSGYSGSGGGSTYTTYEYPEEKMRGQYARRVDPTQAQAIAYRPSMMIPRVAPDLEPTSPLYDMASSMPAAQLGAIMSSNKRVKQPEFPTTRYKADGTTVTSRGSGGTIGSATVNSIGSFYDKMINQESVPSFDELSQGITGARRNSLLSSTLRNQPMGYGAGVMSSYINAATGMLDERSANAYNAEGEALIDKYGAKFMKRPVGKAPDMNKWVGKRLF